MEVPERWNTAVREDVWWFRLYIWFYTADRNSADFCRLFWGFLFMPILFIPVMILRGAISLGFFIKGTIEDLNKKLASRGKPETSEEVEARFKKLEERDKLRRAKRKRREARWNSIFGKIDAAATRLVMFLERVWKYAKYPVYAIGVLLIAAVTAGVGYCLYLISDDVWWVIQQILEWNWFSILIISVCMLLLAAAIFGLSLFATSDTAAEKIGKPTAAVATPFFSAMGTGVKAIKYKTCPQIKVVDKYGRPVGGDYTIPREDPELSLYSKEKKIGQN